MSKGQQSGKRLEQPTHGYSRKPPSLVTRANKGVVHEPVRISFPAKLAMVDVVGSISPGSMLATVDVLLTAAEAPVLPLVAAMFEASLFATIALALATAKLIAEV